MPSCTAAARSGLPERGVSGPTRITGRRDGSSRCAEAVDLEGSRGVEEAVREARAARRRDAALGVVEDHRDPVGAEQDAGVVAEVADDVAHVEPRGEVGRDPAQRLGAAQAGAGLLGRVGALDEDPERAGDGPGEPVAVVAAELDGARDDQDAPRVLAARDPHDQLVGAHAQHGGGPVAAGAGVDRLAGLERLREQAAAGRDVAARGDPRALDVRRARHETAGPELPDPDQRRAGGDAHAVASLVERRVHAAGERGDLGQVRQQVDAGGGVGERAVHRLGGPRGMRGTSTRRPPRRACRRRPP